MSLENDVNLAKRENELKEKEFIENLNEMKKVVKEKGTKIEALIQNNRNLNKQIIKVKKEGVVNISTKIPLYTSASSTSLVSSDSSSKALQTISNESSVSCQTNQIKFMSRSLPNLNSILWFQPSLEEIVRDEAEEVLANIYDNEVEDFFFFFFNLELQLQPRVFISYYVHHCKNSTSGTLGPSFYTGCTMYKFEQEHIVLHKT